IEDAYGFVVRYFEHRLPLDPKTWTLVLGDVERRELRSLVRSAQRLPSRVDVRAGEIERRRRGAASMRRRLRSLLRDTPEREAVAEVLRAWNRTVPDGKGERFEPLDSLIGEQAWLLANWRAAPQEIDYRRFFDIADLVALRSQDEEVFRATHDLIVRLVRDGAVTGLRVD